MAAGSGVRVAVETGSKRVFAAAIDWPGWVRSARHEEEALAALGAYAPRYAPVVSAAGMALPAGTIRIIERVPGTATTDFGAPDAVLDADRRKQTATDLQRLVALLRAAWAVFDATVTSAPAELRKGPRGGGRDRDRIAEHVLGAEQAYGRKIGVQRAQPRIDDGEAIVEVREALARRCLDATAGTPWPIPYFIRRTAWHALDHAWEIEDRST